MPSEDFRVDILCATYNRSALLRGAIESVLAQTATYWRLVIVSDSSTDDTRDVVAEYDDARITFLECAPRRRPGPVRNVGLAASSAPLVAYLDDDDRWRPDHLAEVTRRFADGASWVVAGSTYVDDSGEQRVPARVLGSVWHPELQLVASLFEPSRVAHRRALLDRLGAWSEGQGINRDDWEMWLRFADDGQSVVVAGEPTVEIRASGTTMRHTDAYAADAYPLVVGRAGSPEVARAALGELRTAPLRERFHTLHRTATRAWLADILSSGRAALPPGVHSDQALAEWDRLNSGPLTEGAQPLVDELVADGGDIVYPVPCLHRAHGQRIERLLRNRDRERLDLVARTVERAVERRAR
ncbi:glycosyltransferase family 2 protein [Streptomyces tubbatahanensis]|uniref:Glycosyltransferase family 2 protein n=1 Tax=Streptomyces tubbatahanensis TaxID=2923272 RepID=A0ABY3XKZ4_9ACTN|nr:glycosyltransferase family A protein [Streptomyces tubbatahanensis]UNS95073.1 glycosyltransferase family 2 protein [Streptomyces tubbatahanensis]